MRSIYFLFYAFSLVNSSKIINNVNLPSCRNCVYFKPDKYYSDFTSSLSKCQVFVDKNIITDEITYNYADTCRYDESKCGKEGKYFEEEKNINIKIFIHSITNYSFLSILSIILITFLSAIANIEENK
jgi:hypothetical protein